MLVRINMSISAFSGCRREWRSEFICPALLKRHSLVGGGHKNCLATVANLLMPFSDHHHSGSLIRWIVNSATYTRIICITAAWLCITAVWLALALASAELTGTSFAACACTWEWDPWSKASYTIDKSIAPERERPLYHLIKGIVHNWLRSNQMKSFNCGTLWQDFISEDKLEASIKGSEQFCNKGLDATAVWMF